MVGLRPAAFLDRDGVVLVTNVVTGKPYAIRHVEEYHLLPGAKKCVLDLKSAGYAVIIVTNQPDIENGLVQPDVVDAIHTRLQNELGVDAIYTCPHNREHGCDCRKPKPGMLLQAADDLKLDLNRSWMVGDRASDIAAGSSAGCCCLFIDCGYAEAPPVDQLDTVQNLPEAVAIILSKKP